MTATEIETIKNQFSDRLQIFDKSKVTCSLFGLSETDEKILFEIGLPNYKGYLGDFIKVDNLTLEDGKYMKIYTKKGQENTFGRYININSNEIVYKSSFDKNNKYHFLNKNLESYLKYIQVDEDFHQNVKIPEKLGSYWGTKEEEGNHEKYASELKRRFLEINDDVNKSEYWSFLIEEMDLGVI